MEKLYTGEMILLKDSYQRMGQSMNTYAALLNKINQSLQQIEEEMKREESKYRFKMAALIALYLVAFVCILVFIP